MSALNNITPKVRALRLADSDACGRILFSLPDWFCMEEVNRACIERLRIAPAAFALVLIKHFDCLDPA